GDLGGATELTTYLGQELKNLSSRYYRFTFSDPNTRSLLFSNGYFPAKKGGAAIRVFAYWKDGLGKWQEEDWSDYRWVGLCRDLKTQRASELVIVVSNGEWTPSGGGTLSVSDVPYLKRSNLGCYQYKGTAKLNTMEPFWTGDGVQVDTDVTYKLDSGAN